MKLPTNFSIQDLKNSRFMQTVKNFFNKGAVASFIAKTIATCIIWVGALIPTWLYLLVRMIAGPEGFWQELAILVICAIVVGWLQVILAIIAFVLTFAILVEDI